MRCIIRVIRKLKGLTSMRRVKGVYILGADGFDLAYGPDERMDIAAMVDLLGPRLDRESLANHLDVLEDVEVILSGWGAPRLDEELLAMTPNLKAFFYAAGSLSSVLTD